MAICEKMTRCVGYLKDKTQFFLSKNALAVGRCFISFTMFHGLREETFPDNHQTKAALCKTSDSQLTFPKKTTIRLMMTFSVHETQGDQNNIAHYKKGNRFILFALTSRLFASPDLRL